MSGPTQPLRGRHTGINLESAQTNQRNYTSSQSLHDDYESVQLAPHNANANARGVGVLPYDSAPRYPQSGDDYLSDADYSADLGNESMTSKAGLKPVESHDGTYINTHTGLASAHFADSDRVYGNYGRDEKERKVEMEHGRPPLAGRQSSAWSNSGSPRSPSPFGIRDNIKSGSGYNSPAGGKRSGHQKLVFAEGDYPVDPPSNAFSRFVFAVFEKSFLFRWLIYITPLLIILWIPGIVGVTATPQAAIYGTALVWWSCWTSVTWVSWFGAALIAKLLPHFLRITLGLVMTSSKVYIRHIDAIQFYVGAVLWSFATWISFQPFVRANSTTQSITLELLYGFLRAIFIIMCLLLGEKLLIQLIAYDFHIKAFETRIAEQKANVQTLATLYLNSSDMGRIDTMKDGEYSIKQKSSASLEPSALAKKVLHGAKRVGKTTASLFGTVAAEFTGDRAVPNSSESMFAAALSSEGKSKQLARRIYFSFTPSDRNMLFLPDISHCFPDRESAEAAFLVFDRDENGDLSLEEIESAVLDIHRERRAIKDSMQDIDSAVAKLDSILLSVWSLIAILVIITSLDPGFSTILTGASTLILSFSWLFATSAQEILGSFIFVFIKHAIDVLDRVDIDGECYTVKEIHLLSTVFTRVDGTVVQAPNNILNTRFIHNIRRSGPIAEVFSWDVMFNTSFESIELLRAKMQDFLEVERRDFLPNIAINVNDYAGQTRTTLSAGISYRSNWQDGGLKVARRNKWICALKFAMSELAIYGPLNSGNPVPPRLPVYSMSVPYETPAPVKED